MRWRLLTWLGQWLGRRNSDGASPGAGRERRASARLLCDLKTAWRPAAAPDEPPAPARVRDVSLGGAGLLVRRRLEAGTLLAIDLPGKGFRPLTVLACVAHASAHGPGEWALGCAFSAELTHDELESLGTGRATAAPDRRLRRRPAGTVRALYRPANEEDGPWKPARVADLSTRGVGLLVPRPAPVGTLLSLRLHEADGPASLDMLACVERALFPPGGGCALGCRFIREISPVEVDELLGHPHPAHRRS